MEFEGLRRVATELLILVARWLAQLSLLPQKTASHATLELRATRLFEVTRAVVDPETTPRELADALQSVADLIRSSRRLAAGERHAALN